MKAITRVTEALYKVLIERSEGKRADVAKRKVQWETVH